MTMSEGGNLLRVFVPDGTSGAQVALAEEGIRKFNVDPVTRGAVMMGLNATNAHRSSRGIGWPGAEAENFARNVAATAVEAYRQSQGESQT